MDFYLSHIVRVRIAVKHFVDVGEVSVGHGIVIAEKIVSQNQIFLFTETKGNMNVECYRNMIKGRFTGDRLTY